MSNKLFLAGTHPMDIFSRTLQVWVWEVGECSFLLLIFQHPLCIPLILPLAVIPVPYKLRICIFVSQSITGTHILGVNNPTD